MKDLLSFEKYNVYIVRQNDFKAVKRVGTALEYMDSVTCETNTSKKINLKDYFVCSCEVGTTRDLQLKEDLKLL